MRIRFVFCAALLALVLCSLVFAQRRRGWYEEDYVPTPPDANEKTEFAFARLRYPSWRGSGRGGMWAYRGNWTIDYPKADRHFVQGLRRLTRVHTRSVEQVVDLESDEVYNWPWLYVVEPGHWDLSDAQAAKLRDYLLRGGFLMTDDFHEPGVSGPAGG
jgi:hypothetical protein